jgi:hypothetical protein
VVFGKRLLLLMYCQTATLQMQCISTVSIWCRWWWSQQLIAFQMFVSTTYMAVLETYGTVVLSYCLEFRDELWDKLDEKICSSSEWVTTGRMLRSGLPEITEEMMKANLKWNPPIMKSPTRAPFQSFRSVGDVSARLRRS